MRSLLPSAGRPRAAARLDRGAQARLAVSVTRFCIGGLHAPTLLSGAVVSPLGLVVLLWLLLSSAVVTGVALLAPRYRRGEAAVVAVDVVAIVTVAATTPGGYYPLVLLTTVRLFQVPARWGLRGLVAGGLPITAAGLAWPSPQVSDIHGFVPLLVVCLGIMGAGLLSGWFVRRQNAVHDQTEQALALTFDHSPTGTVLTDGDGVVTRVNAAAVALCGAFRQDMVGRPLVMLIDPGDADALDAVLAGDAGDEVEVRLRTARGPHWARLLIGRIPAAAGLPAYLVVQAEDVHERRTAAERLAHDATHDALTGLPNRRAIHAALDDLLASPGVGGALVMLDLDGFKAVNDRLGHEAGDLLLVAVADRMRSALRDGDLAGRLAGDEMVFLARDVPDAAAAAAVGQRVLDVLLGTVALPGGRVELRASAGVRWVPADERDPRRVFRDADAALYRAKQAGGCQVREHSGEEAAATCGVLGAGSDRAASSLR